MLYAIAKSLVFTSVVMIANFCGMIFKRIVPDEHYLFFGPPCNLAVIYMSVCVSVAPRMWCRVFLCFTM